MRRARSWLRLASGTENDKRPAAHTIGHGEGTIGIDADPANVSDRASKCAIDRGVVTVEGDAYELSNVVETALANALLLAAEAMRWDVVMQIAEELQGRRVGNLAAPRFAKVSS